MKKLPGNIFLGIIYAILYAPLLVMVLFSFNSTKSTFVFEGFSLKWYQEFFRSTQYMEALKNTLILAVLSAVIATILGTAAAVYIFNLRSKAWRNTLNLVTNIPMMNPDIITGVSLMFLFIFIGKLIGASNYLNFGTLLIAHITFNLPYVILNVLPKLTQTDPHLSEAAQDLGSTPVRAFFHIVLPSIMPGIVSGFLMSFTLSLDDFVISNFTNGPSFQTLPLLIYSATKKSVKPTVYALFSLIFVTVLVLLIVSNIIQIHQMKKDAQRKK